MLDVANPSEEFVPDEEEMSTGDEPVQHEEARVVLKRRKP
jgi:hypothetical protein